MVRRSIFSKTQTGPPHTPQASAEARLQSVHLALFQRLHVLAIGLNLAFFGWRNDTSFAFTWGGEVDI